MSRVETPDEKLAKLVKPSLQTVPSLELESEDCIVICAGFEDRAMAMLQSMVAVRSRGRVLLVDYRPYVGENRVEEFRSLCRQGGLALTELAYDRQRPAGFGMELLQSIAGVHGRVFVDVSAMSRLLIVQALVAIGSRPDGFSNCCIAYAEATDYPPSRAEAEAVLARSDGDPTFSVHFLSSGIFDVTVVPELSSTAMTAGQMRLVVFPSLDADQLTSLRAELQPSRYTFVEGIPPSPQNRWRPGLISKLNHLSEMQEAERFTTSTLDYAETLDCLVSLYSKHAARERLVISPTGSKMQTVAVGLFRAFVRDVQLVYPTPRDFHSPAHYTHGIGPLHVLPLDALHPSIE